MQWKISETQGTKSNGTRISQEETFENLGIARNVVLFLGNFRKNGKTCSIHQWKFTEIQTGIFY